MKGRQVTKIRLCHLATFALSLLLCPLATFAMATFAFTFALLKWPPLLRRFVTWPPSMIGFVTWPSFFLKGGEVTKPIILMKICYKLWYVFQGVENQSNFLASADIRVFGRTCL